MRSSRVGFILCARSAGALCSHRGGFMLYANCPILRSALLEGSLAGYLQWGAWDLPALTSISSWTRSNCNNWQRKPSAGSTFCWRHDIIRTVPSLRGASKASAFPTRYQTSDEMTVTWRCICSNTFLRDSQNHSV